MQEKTYSYEEVYNSTFEYFNGDELATKVFINKYALRNKSQELVEINPNDMHWRIANELARIEKNKFKNPMTSSEIFSYLDHFKRIIPQGSIMSGVGNPYQYVTFSNCYVINSPEDSYGGICLSDQQLVQISKRRGGTGLDISKLRPEGTITTNAARTSTGILPFMERFSNSIKEVGQNGRRGALMISISIHHPEVEMFAKIKRDKKKVNGANISVRLTDEFLKAVEENKEYEQRWPVDSDKPIISKMVNARELWMKFIESAWDCAEPGLLFWDNIIRESPADCYSQFKTESTNPCVTSDTWIMTSDGARQVKDLVGKQFNAVVDGKEYPSSDCGFFFTGTKNILKIKSKNGYELKCTPDHLIKVCDLKERDILSYNWKKASDLVKGDMLCLNNTSSEIFWDKDYTRDIGGNFDSGWLVGYLLGDGCFSYNKIDKNNLDLDNLDLDSLSEYIYGCQALLDFWGEEGKQIKEYAIDRIKNSGIQTRSDCGSGVSVKDITRIKSSNLAMTAIKNGISSSKDINEVIEYNSSDFCKGFLRGWFDADGTVLIDNKKRSCSVRLSSTKLGNLKIAQRMLHRLGIVSSIYKNRRDAGFRTLPDGNGSHKEYYCNANHKLVISKNNLVLFLERVGFGCNNKSIKLREALDTFNRGPYKEYFIDKVESIDEFGSEDVYDAIIDTVHQFDANGILVHNCAELPLSPLDSCRLLVINLSYYVENPFTKKAKFNFDLFKQDAMVAQRFMDDVIDLEIEAVQRIIDKIKNDPENKKIKQVELELWENIKKACEVGRRTGVGATALGDALAALGIKYCSPKSLEIVDEIYKTMKLGCYRSSVDMSMELGPFGVWDHQLEKNNPYLLRIKEEDQRLWDDMKKYGRRNISVMTSAPCGSVSILAKTSSGIEPVFKLSYKRKRKINPNDENARVDFIDDDGQKWEEFTVYHPMVNDWMAISGNNNIEDSPWFGCCSSDLEWKKRVRLQSVAQKHIDHSISSTVNLPKDATVDDVSKIYEEAWKSGCKGITIYREGSRAGILVDEESKPEVIIKTSAPKRPKKLPCDVHHLTVKGKQYFVLVGLFDGEPYELFADKNGMISKSVVKGEIVKIKRGQYKAVFDNNQELDNLTANLDDLEDTITRLVSSNLRHGTDIKFLVQQLEKAKGDILSFEKAIARALKKYIKDGTVVTGESCESCNSSNLVRQNGCKTCMDCGWSACG